MSNPNRIETIKKNIQISTLLSDQEKSDWLSLLELMNDKQLGELEEILATEHKTSELPEVKDNSAAGLLKNMPPLSHIANVPMDVNMDRSPMPPAPTPPQPPIAQQPISNFTSKPAPQPQPVPQPIPQRPVSVQAQPQPKPAPQPMPAAPSMPPVAPIINPLPKPRPVATPPVQPQVPQSEPQPAPQQQVPYAINQIEDLQRLNLESLRIHTFESISEAIRNAIAEHGYFAILQLIETSELYAGYLDAGRERLGMKSPSGLPVKAGFTQGEFEFMTDLLRSMRFNRW